MYFISTESVNSDHYPRSGQSDYPRTPQDTPGHPKTLQDSIICMFNILYKRVDDGLVLVCWCNNEITLTYQFGWMENDRTRQSMTIIE